MKFQAVNNYVGIEPLESKVIKKGSIEIPADEHSTPRWAKVLSTGPGVPDYHGVVIPVEVEKGDTVYCMAHGKEDIIDSLGFKSGTAAISILDLLVKLEGKTKIKPLGSYVEIEKIQGEDLKKTGLEIPDALTLPENIARVVTLGTGWKTPTGDDIPFHVKEGDIIVYPPFQVMDVDMSQLGLDDTKVLLKHADIMGILEIEKPKKPKTNKRTKKK